MIGGVYTSPLLVKDGVYKDQAKYIHGDGMATRGELSNLRCVKAKPRLKPYSLFDSGGLYLLVMPTGGKLWRWAYRFEGKPRLMAFGKYPDVPIADARLLHAHARQSLANGVDPMALRKEGKQQKKVELAEVEKPAGLTFESLLRSWFEKWKTNKDAGYIADVEARLERDIIAKVGSRAPGDITRVEWVRVIQAIEARGARDLARRALQNVNQIYNFGLDNGHLDPDMVNPAAGIRPDKILDNVVEEHFPSLPIGEIPALLCNMRDYNGSALTRIAMELLSLTFLRTSELIGGRWSEIDWEEKRWNIPKERMKGIKAHKKPHIVPLSEQAMVLLNRLHTITGENDRMFPVTTGGPGVMSNNTILQALDHMGYKGRMSGHGWRSVASTYLHEKGFNHEHIELQLAHSKEDKVSGERATAFIFENDPTRSDLPGHEFSNVN